MTEWQKVAESIWYRRGIGTVSRRCDGWWGSNSVSAGYDIEPVVGPFPTRREACERLFDAVEAHRKEAGHG